MKAVNKMDDIDLTRTTKRQNTQITQRKKGPHNRHSRNPYRLRERTDRAWFSRLVLYDIRPGNGAGLFLQPRSPHGAAHLT